MSGPNSVSGFYKTVISDVMKNCRDAFLNEDIDEQVLRDLTSIWTAKVEASHAVDTPAAEASHAAASVGKKGVASAAAAAPNLSSGDAMVASGGNVPGQLSFFNDIAHTGIRELLTARAAQMTADTMSTIRKKQNKSLPPQFDGAHASSSEEDEDDEDDADDDEDDDDDETDELLEGLADGGTSEHEYDDPLGPNDDGSESDGSEIFDTENVVVCQFDRVARTRNKWKFTFKDGIMNLNGKDHVFIRANGEAEW